MMATATSANISTPSASSKRTLNTWSAKKMKKSIAVKFGLSLSVIVLITIGFLIPSRVDNALSHATMISINLRYSNNFFPTINELIDDVIDDGERVVFNPNAAKEISKIFDIKYLDISGGRLFFLREKRNLWGRNRTFILHRDVRWPIIIDNSSSQDSRLTWMANRQSTFSNVKNLDQGPE
jgi:hypothetical protein